MEMIMQILILAVGFVMLIKGAGWFVDGSSAVATRLGIPQLVIGLTIVAMGTSAPEAAVSIVAALNGNADITIGNIVGSNILNILIILGISALIVPVAVAKATIKLDIPVMLAITVLLLVFGYNGTISLVEGIIFWVIFAIYLAYLFINSKNNTEENVQVKELSLVKALVFAVIGLCLIILGSKLTVNSATAIAKAVGISERFIGLTIVALGTSLPELFTSVLAAKKGNADIAIGNIVGSNIFNILFIVGASSIITPVNFATGFRIDTVIAFLAGIMLLLCSIPRGKIGKKTGVLMLLSYAGYFCYLLM